MHTAYTYIYIYIYIYARKNGHDIRDVGLKGRIYVVSACLEKCSVRINVAVVIILVFLLLFYSVRIQSYSIALQNDLTTLCVA